MSIFGDETIPVNSESPEGHDEETAVDTENEEEFEEQEVDSEQDQEDEESSGNEDSDADEEQQEHSDELLAGKYKTTDDLVKGYKELERQFHQSRNQQPGNQTAVVQQPGQQTQQPDLNNVFWERFRDNPLATMESVISHIVGQQTAPIHEERRNATLSSHIQNVASIYPQVNTEEGMKQLIGKVREFAEEVGNPELLRNPTDKVMRFAAREAFGDTASKAFQKGKEAGRGESERTRQSKQGLGTKGGARQQAAPAMTEEESTKAGILAAGKGGGLFG